jgi:hypothetical protein
MMFPAPGSSFESSLLLLVKVAVTDDVITDIGQLLAGESHLL